MAIRQKAQVDLLHWLPHMCMPLFDLGLSVEYGYWKGDDASWQLRCIGGPGSGKTTLAYLIIKDLESSFDGSKTAIVSIFLQPLSPHSVQSSSYRLSTELLLEIQRQLSTCTARLEEDEPDKVDIVLEQPNDGDETRYEWIRARIQPLDQAFLVIDDLDLAFYDIVQYREFESQLSRLQSLGFKILATSRVPYQTAEERSCDVDKNHTDGLRVWWYCKACGPDVYDICYACKNAGHGCNEANHAGSPLIQAPSKVEVHINHFSKGLDVLVREAIQREHGDLGLGDTTHMPGAPSPLPPLSILGQELTTPANQVAKAAARLADETAERSDHNVTVALVRLDHIGKARTLKEARVVADRLPRDLQNVFNAGISGIADRARGLERFLGLQSIRIVGHYNGEMPYDELCEGLRGTWKGDESELLDVLYSEDAVEQVLFAARGFLKSRAFTGGPWMSCFQEDFHIYVAENYSEILSQL